MIRDYKEPPYIICGCCGRAFKGWEAYNELSDDYSEGPDEVEDPSYYLYKSCTMVECPYCHFYDSVYGVHVPTRYTVTCGKQTVEMTPDEIMTPPAQKRSFGGFSLKPSGFSLTPPGTFCLSNVKRGTDGMRKVPRRANGRRWS